MGYNLIIVGLLVLVIAAFIARVRRLAQQETLDDERGSTRKSGFHIIHAEYSSGMSGHQTTYKVPCDPQEYAQLFIPKETETKK
jgi:hypothetical protein